MDESAVMPLLGDEEEDSMATTTYEPSATSGMVKVVPAGMEPEDVVVTVVRSVENMDEPCGPDRYTDTDDDGSQPFPVSEPEAVGYVPETEMDGLSDVTVIGDADVNSALVDVGVAESLAMR